MQLRIWRLEPVLKIVVKFVLLKVNVNGGLI